MLITDRFVLLNLPKTGTTFARTAIRTLYKNKESKLNSFLVHTGLMKPSVEELMMPKIDEIVNYNIKDQHGTYRQIPIEHNHKPIITITRNPFTRFLSGYYFKWWVDHPAADLKVIKETFPKFPDISINEYYEMGLKFGRKNRLKDIIPKYEIGGMSIQFIQFYAKNPESLLSEIDDNYFNTKKYKEDFKHIRFIHQEFLVDEIIEFLVSVGFDKKDLSFINDLPRINVTKTENINLTNFRNYFSEELVQKIVKEERLLFKMFPEYLP
ncbi:MAG: sulfotransferase family 2 domain-containing protein [Bacteroidales bacterium]